MQFSHFTDPVKKQIYVEFSGALYRLKPEPAKSLISTFLKLGGVVDSNISTLFVFPIFITSKIIEEIIRNTCFECGGLMKDGVAMINGKLKVESYDSAVDTYQGVIEYNDSRNFRQIKVRKCTVCGHSHT